MVKCLKKILITKIKASKKWEDHLVTAKERVRVRKQTFTPENERPYGTSQGGCNENNPIWYIHKLTARLYSLAAKS